MRLSPRSILILETLLRYPKGVTRDFINEILENNGEKPVDDRRRLFKYFDAFRDSLKIIIDHDKLPGNNYSYRLSDGNNAPGYSKEAVSKVLEQHFLREYSDLGPRIQPVFIPRGSIFLRSIGDAMRTKHLLRVTYKKFNDIEPYDCVLSPHALKAFEGRWYLFAVKWMSEDEVKDKPLGYKGYGLQSFALDRMQNVSMMRQRFKLLKGFDAGTFFLPFFGVYCHMGDKPSRILVHASEDDAHYIRTLPIHHSQKETKHNEFELKLVPAKDFEIYMRRFPDTTWEVAEETGECKTKPNEA